MNIELGNSRRTGQRGWIACWAVVAFLASSAMAKINTCAATDAASLQTCINAGPDYSDTASVDTQVISYTYTGTVPASQQIRINHKRNVWIIGDTSGATAETSLPRIIYQDAVHTYTDLNASKRGDTSAAGTYGQNNGAVWIYLSENIRLEGVLVDGNSAWGATANNIFAYGATLGQAHTVEIRGNVGVSILMSHNVQLRYVSVRNAWNGIAVLSPNLGGAFAYPDPNDPDSEVVATLPTSQAGLYGNHLIERCRIHDNTFGILFQRDWDLGSVIRNNVIWGNYLRHWADPKTNSAQTVCPTTQIVKNLCQLDTALRNDGSRRSLAYTTVGGAFLMTDVAITPYRIHNNTFYNNATIFTGYYKTGTQHLFYNNLVGKPYQFFRTAAQLPVQQSDLAGTKFDNAYTQTERQSEMLMYLGEHQRSNRVLGQDSLPTSRSGKVDLFSANGANLRLYNMRAIRYLTNGSSDWLWSNTTWSNNYKAPDDTSFMTWVPDTTSSATTAQLSDSGGLVKWVRQNMWVGSAPDPGTDSKNSSSFDMHLPDAANGSHWSPPWIPTGIRSHLSDPSVFRDMGTFDVRWTFQVPLDTVSATTAATYLRTKTGSNLKLVGWPTYEGTASSATEATKAPLAIGAYDLTGAWAAPSRRLVLRDTLIESVTDSMVKFKLNASGEGFDTSAVDSIKVSSAKFYNDVPVSDTLYNQGTPKTGANAGNTSYTTTRENSILSSKPWPLPYQFVANTDYDRKGAYNVDDSLTRHKLSSDNYFLARISNASKRLPSDSIYARAEVVLKAYMKDGTVVYSNPAVFMYSRPRYQFSVTLTDMNGKALPTDADGISVDVNAGQPFRAVVKVKTSASTLPFSGFKNMVIGNLSSLVGPSGTSFDLYDTTSAAWKILHANDTVNRKLIGTSDSVIGVYHGMYSPGQGTLSFQARFVDSHGSLLRYTIGGSSVPVKIIAGSIYQVTIDTVYKDTTRLTSPSLDLKLYANSNLAGRRDTLLSNGTDTSKNIAQATRGDTLKVVLCVRDRYGNQVQGADSVSAKKGIYIKLSHKLVPSTRYSLATTDHTMLQVDSLSSCANIADSVRLSYDSTGHAYGFVAVSSTASKAAVAALRASLVDSNGREPGASGATRDSSVVDTTWVEVQQTSQAVEWTDSSGGVRLSPIDGWVGSWYPVRLKMIKDKKGIVSSGNVALTWSTPLHLYKTQGDTTTSTSTAVFTNDSLSAVLWVRATDSTSVGWIKAVSDTLSDSVGSLKFKYPSVKSSAFYDRDCDGKVDSLVVKFSGPLSFRASSGVVVGDTLDAKFPHQYLSLSAMGAPQRVTVRDSSFSFVWTPGALGAADASANRVTIANPLASGVVISFKLDSLKDKAPPILVKAMDLQTWASTGAQDSLVATFSEAIDVSTFTLGASLPFVVVRNGSTVALTGDVLTKAVQLVDTGAYAFVFNGSASPIVSGDSLKINATAISDLAGNLSGTTCPDQNVLIGLTPRFTPLVGYVIDVTGDGNADSVHLAFKDSLGIYPEKIFVQWGTPAETLTVTKTQLIALGVKTSDSTITLATNGWHGKTVIIDGDTVYNAPRTVGPLDSAWFNGGVVSEYLRDSVPPVLIHARLKYGPSVQSVDSTGYDTLDVDFSEVVGGCAVGSSPSACLSAKGVSTGAFTFPQKSVILSTTSVASTTLGGAAGTTATRWIVLVPKGAISVGDSIRSTPASANGLVHDLAANYSGAAAWVYVNGDPMPPSHGWMLDLNGDGKVDAVLLHFLTKPTVSTLPTYQFEWGTATGVATTLTSDSAYQWDAAGLYWIAVLGTKGEFGATGYPPASVRMLGLQKTSTAYKFWVSDSVGPVLKSPATLDASSDTVHGDTLIVIPSEPMASPTKSVLLEFKKGGHAIPADSVVFVSAVPLSDGTWRVILSATSPYRPNPGDSVRLSTSGSARDTVGTGNVPSVNHPWVPLTGALRLPYLSYYSDLTSDGRVDAVTLDFAVAPVVGTIVKVYDPAGSGTYKQFTITAADSGKKTITFSFADNQWGANVTSWTNTNLGVLTPATGSDTAVHGGAFPILDKVAPVIVSATERYTSDTSLVDTLKIVFSEKIDVASILNSIWISSKTAGDTSSTGTAVKALAYVYDSATKTLTLYMRPFPVSVDTVNPQVNDSVRIRIGVTDLSGNASQTDAKYTVVTGNKRIFPPVPTLSNAIVTPASENAQSGDILKNPDGSVSPTFDVVVRPSSPDNSAVWETLNPDGTTTSTGTTYDPSHTADYGSVGHTGTVFYVSTNVPLEIKLYIYDLVGIYVASQSVNIDSTILASIKSSKIGMSDVGIRWKGQDASGRLVGTGIYPVRLIASRKTSSDERAEGEANNLMYNKLMKVGVHLKAN